MSDLQNYCVDYSMCILCQEFKNEKLLNPQFNGISISNFQILEAFLIEFNELTELKDHLKHLLNGGCLAKILFENNAEWHKSCRVKYNQTSLNKLRKRVQLFQTSDESEVCEIPTELDFDYNACIFCKGNDQMEALHTITKESTYRTIIEAAGKLQDNVVIARLNANSGKGRYHSNCFTDKYKKSKLVENEIILETDVASDAFKQLWIYIKATLETNESSIFTLRDLKTVFMGYLDMTNNSEFRASFNSTRFKNRILEEFPSLREFKKGKDIFLAEDVAIAEALSFKISRGTKDGIKKACAEILRKSMSETSYHNNSNLLLQESSVSTELQSFMHLLLNGTDVEDPTNLSRNQALLTICQLIKYNSFAVATQSTSKKRHTLGYETPLTRYVALSTYLATRKKKMVNKFHKLGLGLSYSRVLEITTNVANSLCDVFEREKVVYPTNLNKGHFVTVACDNIDHNYSSTTSIGSFHGTAISVNIHPNENIKLDNEELSIFSSGKGRKMKKLPSEYTYVEPMPMINCTKTNFPVNANNLKTDNSSENEELAEFQSAMNSDSQNEWLAAVEKAMKTESTEPSNQFISWSAFHGNKVRDNPVIVDKTGLLPLFNDKSTNPAMIRHAMKITMNVTAYLNPGQTPVFTGDQPIFAIAKELQWLFPDELGEEKLFIMFGGFHIEKTFLICIGDWLTGSEWDIALTNANIFTPGTAESLMKSTHVTKTRMSHQITAAVLYILKRRAFEKEKLDETKLDEWEKRSCLAHPKFFYWNATLQLELLLLDYVKSIRERNLDSYISTLEKMVPWFFALDHTHYARWISVHIRDLKELITKHPSIYEAFKAGKFSFQKTSRCFSAMAIDQSHEQHNAQIKGDGGAIGILDNESALLRWMVAGPELARIVVEFGEKHGIIDFNDGNNLHHDMTNASQKRFLDQVSKLLAELERNGNPFEADSEMISLVNKYKFDNNAIISIRTAEEVGTKHYNKFVRERFVENTVKFSEKIVHNNLRLLRPRSQRKISKSHLKLELVKSDCQLFSRLYIGARNRNTDLDNFFNFENQPFPPSISENGNLRSGKTADIIKCFSDNYNGDKYPQQCTAMICQGEHIAQMVKASGTSKTFNDYYRNDFEPYLLNISRRCERLDIIFETLKKGSLISGLRSEKSEGRIQRVNGDQNLPRKWIDFLSAPENCINLYHFLAERICNAKDGLRICTKEDSCISNFSCDLTNVSPCKQERSETRIFLHVQDMLLNGHTKIIIRTLDPNVVAIAISLFPKLCSYDLSELWIWYGTNNQLEYIPIHEICSELGGKLSSCVAFFHAFTGCKTVSFFHRQGKKKAFKLFKQNENLLDVVTQFQLKEFNDLPSEIEKFVARLYDASKHSGEVKRVNSTRKHLFVQKNRAMENLPPTKAALLQHFKRAIYQAVGIWDNSLVKIFDAPSPSDWGWKEDVNNHFVPFWTSQPQLSDVCAELLRCGCKSGCKITSNCGCRNAKISCTPLCQCQGKCQG